MIDNLYEVEPDREFRPNATTLESFAQYERGETTTLSVDEFCHWLQDVKNEVEQEEQLAAQKHA
ncbi:MAG: hypothetical protein QM537_08055 [Candidatus Symbiobacter sp.]|nr:hypothetical protein [Candidatus Symbiobacter sp.]